MITETTGDLLRDDAEALVNAVNTVGVMGKGLALEFRRAFPEVFSAYAEACADGRLRLGKVFPARLGDTGRWIVHGGLSWGDVRPLIREKLAALKMDVRVYSGR